MRTKLLSAAVLALAAFAPVSAQSAPSPKPTPATLCLAKVAFLIPLDADGFGMARSYLMTLAPFTDSAGVASGTITVYDAADRWNVPFRDAVVATEGQTPDPTPIVVRFPQSVRVDGARLASLDGPDGGPCRPFSVAPVTPAQVTSKFVERVLAKAAAAHAIDAPSPVPDPAPACAYPNVPASDIKPAQPDTPETAKMRGEIGVVGIHVWLDDTGQVLAANVYQTSGWPDLDDASLKAAINSGYSPAVRNCRPAGDSYMFRVEFAADMGDGYYHGY